MIRNILTLMLLWCTTIAFAQNDNKAVTILKASADALKANKGIEAKFILAETDAEDDIVYTFKGILKIKGEKFYIEVPEARIWYNGKDQWVWLNNSDEVNLSNPSKDETLALNPVTLLELYKYGAKVKYVTRQSINGKEIDVIDINPGKTELPWVKIVAMIDRNTNFPYSISMIDQNNTKTNIVFDKPVKDINLQIHEFEFDRKKFPKPEIIDLR